MLSSVDEWRLKSPAVNTTRSMPPHEREKSLDYSILKVSTQGAISGRWISLRRAVIQCIWAYTTR
jgi:hypothetical protein